MPHITEADRYLIEQIRGGNAEGWAQLVARYQGRLLAFARGRLGAASEAEDLVQETFISFLQALGGFRDEQSLETFLFTILRRKLIDLYRGRHLRACFIQDVLAGKDAQGAPAGGIDLESAEPTASWYARRDEQAERSKAALAAALTARIDRLKEAANFRDLKVIELLFYAQLRNKDAAEVAGVDEKQIALIKHRVLNELRAQVGARLGSTEAEPDSGPGFGSMLTEVWEEQRFTCPKRSTIGRFLLGTLEEPWAGYLEFHINKVGCRMCQANVADLRSASAADGEGIGRRVFESTVGFFRAGR